MSVAASVWPAILFLSLNVLGQNPNPVPFINQPVVPAAVAPNGTAFTLTINGTNFSSGSVVNWNGNARSTTFISASQLTAAISASDIAAASTAVLTVTNPGPGGGTSNNCRFGDWRGGASEHDCAADPVHNDCGSETKDQATQSGEPHHGNRAYREPRPKCGRKKEIPVGLA